MPGEPDSGDTSSAQTVVNLTPTGQALPLRPPSGPEFDILSNLQSSAKLVERVVCRQLIADSQDGAVVPVVPTNPTLDVLEKLITSFRDGTSSKQIQAEIEKLLNAQDERSNLVNNLLVVHDVDRLPQFLRLRAYIENYLVHAATQGGLTPAEALAFLKISQTEIETISSRVRSGANPVKDIEELIQRADFVNKASDRELMEKFKTTSPQGREILRKISHKIAKAARDPNAAT
jgi:hypothetical protein